MLTLTPSGLYCPAGDFYIDPWRPVARAVVTHAHSDHARPGHAAYLTTPQGLPPLRTRLGPEAHLQTLPYGKLLRMGAATVSLHPAGHILGSAQVRVAVGGEVWVVSGDYKTEPDATCTPFEPVACHTFITECTFGLPIYRWQPQAVIAGQLSAWWAACQAEGRCAVLYGYALGKAQRLLSLLDPQQGPIYVHGAVHSLNQAYAEAGVALPPSQYLAEAQPTRAELRRALVLAPPNAAGTPWLRKLGPVSEAFASGWMQIRGTRRRRALDRGFVLSDHVDWPALLATVAATGARRVLATHGYTAQLAAYLQAQGLEAAVLETEFGQGEEEA
ncbi:MAG: ligase-associated DNA damage response exonuclease [Bacteroidia bacterium]|nr:ligase-associated DNA damage response exonuclease [Bacteroidia bacterium]